MNVSTGNRQQLTVSEQQLIDSRQEIGNSQQLRMSSGQELRGCDDVPDSQQQQPSLPETELEQRLLPEFAISSDELLRGRQALTLDAVTSPHNYLDDLCPVCNDRVSGYHYGLQTCESCKGKLIYSR